VIEFTTCAPAEVADGTLDGVVDEDGTVGRTADETLGRVAVLGRAADETLGEGARIWRNKSSMVIWNDRYFDRVGWGNLIVVMSGECIRNQSL